MAASTRPNFYTTYMHNKHVQEGISHKLYPPFFMHFLLLISPIGIFEVAKLTMSFNMTTFVLVAKSRNLRPLSSKYVLTFVIKQQHLFFFEI